MSTWDLTPGNEHPLAQIRKAPPMSTRKALTAPEIRSRLDDLGAKTRDMTGGTFLVYPRGAEVPPVRVPGRIRGGTELPNILTQLRRAGWDLRQECARRAPDSPLPSEQKDDTAMSTTAVTPATVMPKQRQITLPGPRAIAEMSEQIETLLKLFAELQDKVPTRAAVSDLRSAVTAAETREADLRRTAAALEARCVASALEIGTLRRDLDAALTRIAALEAGSVGEPAEKPISRAEQSRRDVLAFFESLPRGIRMSPENVRRNLGYPKETEDGRVSTRISNACAELVKAGMLQGGGKRTAKDDPDFGMYWLPAEESTATDAA